MVCGLNEITLIDVVVYSLSHVPLFFDPMDHSPPGFSVLGTFQARVLEWVDISFSEESSQPRDQTQVSQIADRCFNTKEAIKGDRKGNTQDKRK